MKLEEQLSAEQYNALYTSGEELGRLVKSIKLAGGYPGTKKNRIASAFLVKATKTLNAITILCKAGYGEDAVILARSLFDMLVDILYITRFKLDTMADRYELYDDVWRAKALNAEGKSRNLKKLIRERMKNLQPGDETPEQLNTKAVKAMKRFKYRSDTWRPRKLTLYDMAVKVKLGSLYQTMFKLHSQVVHTAPRIINNYAVIKNGHLNYTYQPSHKHISDALISSFTLTLGILKVFNELTHTISQESLDSIEMKHGLVVMKIFG